MSSAQQSHYQVPARYAGKYPANIWYWLDFKNLSPVHPYYKQHILTTKQKAHYNSYKKVFKNILIFS